MLIKLKLPDFIKKILFGFTSTLAVTDPVAILKRLSPTIPDAGILNNPAPSPKKDPVNEPVPPLAVKAYDAVIAYDAVASGLKLRAKEDVDEKLAYDALITPINPLPPPINEPVKDPVLYEDVKALKELVVTKLPVS
jgi:hypothetical protein